MYFDHESSFDWSSVIQKLAVGGMPEKLLTAFQAVEEEHLKEDAALNNCKAAVHYVTRFEDDIEKTITQGKNYALGSYILHPSFF